MKKIIFILGVLVFVGLIFLFVNYIGKIAPSNTSVIKKYTFPERTKDILFQIKTFCETDSNFKTRITDTTGTLSTGYSYYLDIEIKRGDRHIRYGLVCDENKDATIAETAIKLVLAYDINNNIGGYNKSEVGINELVDYFETNFIVPFEKYQHLQSKI